MDGNSSSENLIPRSGSKELTYASSGLAPIGWYAVFFGVVFTTVSVVMLVGVTKAARENPASVQGPLWIFWLFLTIFAGAGIGIILTGAAYLLAKKNEKIILTPAELVWIDRTGKERVRCAYSQVISVKESPLGQLSGSKYRQVHHRCVVATENGTIVFSDNISSYEELRDTLASRQSEHKAYGVFRYRSTAIFVVSAFVFPLTAFMCATFIASYVHGEQMSVNGKTEQTPLVAPLMVVAISAVFWGVLGYAMLTCLFERIEVSDGRLIYRNAFGIKKVEVPLTMIERGSFEERDSQMTRGALRYQVQTPQGLVKWSDQIVDCSNLVQILQSASDSSNLSGDFRG